MKIAVFSDSHRNIANMREAVRAERPDYIFHLGDHYTDAEQLSREFADIPVCKIRGNCDLSPVGELRVLTRLGGRTIFAAHGHTYNVKYGYDAIINTAMSAGADILLFGHTHIPYEEERDGLIIINPGAIGYGMTYEIIEIEDGMVKYARRSVYDLR